MFRTLLPSTCSCSSTCSTTSYPIHVHASRFRHCDPVRWTVLINNNGNASSTSLAAKRGSTAQPDSEEPEGGQSRGATPSPSTRAGSKPRGRPRKTKAPSEMPPTPEVEASARAPTTDSTLHEKVVRAPTKAPSPAETDALELGVPAIPRASLESVTEAEAFATDPTPVKQRRRRRSSSKIKDEAELETDLTGSRESGMRPPAPPPPHAAYVEPEAPDADAVSGSRQQSSQPAPGSLISQQEVDMQLAQQQQEYLTPGLDQSTADLAAKLVGSAAPTSFVTQSNEGAHVGASSSSWYANAPKPDEPGLKEGGPLTDPGFAERMGGLPDMGWEKTALREALGGIDLYRRMRTDVNEVAHLPGSYILPHNATAKERAFMEFCLIKGYWDKRNAEREEVHQAAFLAHDNSRARVSNIYANTRRVAGLMTAFEDDDYKLQEASPANIAPWARAELVFSKEFEEFNDYILKNADRLVKDMPKEAEEDELDIVDEALFLLRTEDDEKAAARTSQQQADQDLIETYLEGVLPGATLDSLATTYANEIFEADEFDVDMDDEKAGASLARGDAEEQP